MYRVGIIGLGKMGMEHANWIIENKDLRLEAICEKNQQRGLELREEYKVNVYHDLDEFLRSDIDLVVIATTNEVHEMLSVRALNAGKDVIVEKPMSVDYPSTVRMVEAAKKAGKKILVHQSSRWDRDYCLVKDTIRSGIIGDVLCIQSKAMFCDEGWGAWGIDGIENPWRIKREYGGGMLLDWGPHLVDQMVQLVGTDPKSVYGIVQNGFWSEEVDDYFFATLNFGDNTVYQIECSNTAKFDLPRWYVMGTNGALVVKGRRDPFWHEAELTYIDQYGKMRTERIELHDVAESGMEGGFYDELVPYLQRKTDTLVDMVDASNVVKVLELIEKSSNETRVVGFSEI